jgi:Zn2+/Cd2+-exporting ATPase
MSIHTEKSHAPVKKTGCSSCEHCHEESPLPQGALVTASGVLTGIGLLLHWFFPREPY